MTRLSPELAAARAAEQRRRLIAYLPQSEPIVLRCGDREVACPVVHLTERHRLELTLAGSAFFAGRAPLLGDVFQLLWRLHPDWRRPLHPSWLRVHPSRRARPLPRWRSIVAYGRGSGAAHAWLARVVQRCDLYGAAAAIETWIEHQYQDEPAARVDDTRAAEPAAPGPARCLPDVVTRHFARAMGIDPRQVVDVPIALLHQWHREELLATGRAEAVIDPSEQLAPA